MKEIINSIKSLLGLFIPMKFNGKWGGTVAIGHIYLGWIIVAIVVAVLSLQTQPKHPPVGDIPLQQTCFTDLPETNFKDGAFRLSNELK
jgi:hypothetical protein